MKIHQLLLLMLLPMQSFAGGVEFAHESEKAAWIKNYVKDKKFYCYRCTKQEKQLMQDFLAQKGIEHIEPIAKGKGINDPEIAKFNQACPDKKPIDIVREWRTPSDDITEDMLENEEFIESVTQRRCLGNFKIYKLNLYNTKDNAQNHILYCDDYRTERFSGKMKDLTKHLDENEKYGVYLKFDPEKCSYSKEIICPSMNDLVDDYFTGIFKYKKRNYMYSVNAYIKQDNKKFIKIKINDDGIEKGLSIFTTDKNW